MFRKLASVLVTVGLLLACGGGTQQDAQDKGTKEKASKGTQAARTAAEKATAKAIEKESGKKADVKITNEGMTIETDGGGKMEISSGGAAKIPADFPADVFLYKGGLIASTKIQNTVQLQFRTPDSAAAIQEAYKKEMAAKGWKETMNMATESVVMLHYEKEKRRAMIHVVPEEKGTLFTVAVEEPEKE